MLARSVRWVGVFDACNLLPDNGTIMDASLYVVSQNAIIRNCDGSVLILKHLSGKWMLPGGKMKQGESCAAALRRELLEEIGLRKFRVEEIVDVHSWEEDRKNYLGVTYSISVGQRFHVSLGDEHTKVSWVRSDGLAKYNFFHSNIPRRLRAFWIHKENTGSGEGDLLAA